MNINELTDLNQILNEEISDHKLELEQIDSELAIFDNERDTLVTAIQQVQFLINL
jgi:hypothetical protein